MARHDPLERDKAPVRGTLERIASVGLFLCGHTAGYMGPFSDRFHIGSILARLCKCGHAAESKHQKHRQMVFAKRYDQVGCSNHARRRRFVRLKRRCFCRKVGSHRIYHWGNNKSICDDLYPGFLYSHHISTEQIFLQETRKNYHRRTFPYRMCTRMRREGGPQAHVAVVRAPFVAQARVRAAGPLRSLRS